MAQAAAQAQAQAVYQSQLLAGLSNGNSMGVLPFNSNQQFLNTENFGNNQIYQQTNPDQKEENKNEGKEDSQSQKFDNQQISDVISRFFNETSD